MALKIFFGSLMADYIKESGRDLGTVATMIPKTPRSQFTKWKTGKWGYITEEKLLRLIDVVAQKDRDKSIALMIAYLIDMTPERFRGWIDIRPRTGEADDVELLGRSWSRPLRAKIEAIGQAYARDNDFMRMADNLGNWAKTINERPAGKK